MKSLMNIIETKKLIESKKNLLIAGDETLLKQLPQGNWIGGTIPYFMSEKGGLQTNEALQVTVFPDESTILSIKTYSTSNLKNIPRDYSKNGFSMVLVPALSEAHQSFAQNCMSWDGIFNSPLVGWITGIDLKDLGKITPKIINGQTLKAEENSAVVMHLELPATKYAKVNIINLFKQGSGDKISFESVGFGIQSALINNEKVNFAKYIEDKKINTQLPLVADYMGAMINVSFQSVDSKNGTVNFYAPVFPGITYRLAEPIENYEKQFEMELSKHKVNPVFTCNCILNYLYAHLEGKKTGGIVGPMTFGEIAYILLNQTMVYLTFESRI